MQKPSKCHKLTSDNLIKFKKPVHDPFKGQVLLIVITALKAQGQKKVCVFLRSDKKRNFAEN